MPTCPTVFLMNVPPDNTSALRPRGGAWPRALAVVALAALAAFTLLAWRTMSLPGGAAAWTERVAAKLGGMFGTKVQVENSSFTLDQKEIAELATVQRRLVCTTRYDVGSWGSSATVIVRGVYRAKAGFDLRKRCKFTFSEGRILNAQLPPPELLSLSTEEQKVYFASEGLLQKLGPMEMERAYAENLAQARREAASMGLLDDAQARLKERMGDLLSDQATEVRVQPLPKALP